MNFQARKRKNNKKSSIRVICVIMTPCLCPILSHMIVLIVPSYYLLRPWVIKWCLYSHFLLFLIIPFGRSVFLFFLFLLSGFIFRLTAAQLSYAFTLFLFYPNSKPYGSILKLRFCLFDLWLYCLFSVLTLQLQLKVNDLHISLSTIFKGLLSITRNLNLLRHHVAQRQH